VPGEGGGHGDERLLQPRRPERTARGAGAPGGEGQEGVPGPRRGRPGGGAGAGPARPGLRGRPRPRPRRDGDRRLEAVAGPPARRASVLACPWWTGASEDAGPTGQRPGSPTLYARRRPCSPTPWTPG